jgi:putative transcriptional regulator
MRPEHHPSHDTMAAYAAGALASGFALVVGAHVEHCAVCRSTLRTLEAVSGSALEALPDVAMSEGALEKALARLDAAPLPPLPDARPFLQRLPLKRRKWVAPGAWVAAVDTPRDESARVYVLGVKAGFPTARHQHEGLEFCTVLEGAFRDQSGLYRAGDFAASEGDYAHQPLVEGDRDCVCIFATEAKLRPKGIISSLVFWYANV